MQLKKNDVVPTSSQDEALARYSVSREVPHFEITFARASLVAQTVKNLPETHETPVQSLGRENALEKAVATHSSILAWRIPRTEEPGGLQSMGSQRVRHD